MKNQLSLLLGVLDYEFRMQFRRRALWITFLIFTMIVFVLVNQGDNRLDVVFPKLLAHFSLPQTVAVWTFSVSTYLPICLGVLLADRLTRDRKTRVEELFSAMPVEFGTRMIGKLLGTMLATLIPMLLVEFAGIGYLISLSHNPMAILYGLETFGVIALPGIIFISAFSIAIPALLWLPLYQFGFICYWLWNTLWFHAELLNPGRTILSPNGLYAAMGFYQYDIVGAYGGSNLHPIKLSATVAESIESILLLIALSAIAMVALSALNKWQQAHH